MAIHWEILGGALLGFSATQGLQASYMVRALDNLFEREKDSHDTAIDYLRWTRQDTAGVMLLLHVTNALLGGILGTLLGWLMFR